MTRPTDSKLPTSVMELPFFNDRNILVAASLNGGNILSQFVDLLQRWSTEMGMEQIPIKNDLFSLLIEKAGEFEAQRSAVCGLSITPTLLGERHMPTKKGSVEGIGADVPGLGQVFSATCRGLVVNLLGMMPRDILQQYEVCKQAWLYCSWHATIQLPLIDNILLWSSWCPTVLWISHSNINL